MAAPTTDPTPTAPSPANSSPPPLYTDHPLALIPTPFHTTGATDPFTLEASNMALSHNVLIRGFNSIYQTAPRLFPETGSVGSVQLSLLSKSERAEYQKDFVEYCLAWARLLDEHHRVEEEGIFPAVEEIVGEKGVMGREAEEHVAIHNGVESIRTYLTSLSSPTTLSPTTLLSILDSFSAPLHTHLTTEPLSLAALSRFAAAFEAANTTLVEVSLAEGKKAMASLDFILNVLPCFMLNMEFEEFEDGYWTGKWPDIKGVGRWAIFNVVPMWHSKRWRFTSCDAQGKRKRLAV